MNDQQAKALFFAQYYGQKVFKSLKWGDREPVNNAGKTFWYYAETDGSYLSLRSLSDLTDEEANEVAKMLCYEEIKKDDERPYNLWWGIKTAKEEFEDFTQMGVGIADYLRSIGILLPFREYTVGDILEKKWAVLKK